MAFRFIAFGIALSAWMLSAGGCATLPDTEFLADRYVTQNARFESAWGPISARQSAAILNQLQGKSGNLDVLDKQISLEQDIVDSPLVVGNRVTLLQDGPATYNAMFAAIEEARDHVNVESYIIEDDEVGRRFADLLIDRQIHGVHAYGRSPIGTLSDIEKVPIEKLQAFYRNYYQPDDAMLLVAGKFDPAKTLDWITEYFGSHSQAHPQLAPANLHRGTHPGRRTGGGSAARGRSPVGHDGVPRPGRVASGFAGIGRAVGHLVGCTRGASLQGPGREQEGRQRRRRELFYPPSCG